jgi:hypothetical protein
VAHYKAVEDFNEDLLRPTSYYQDEVHSEDCIRQQEHRNPHIYWHYGLVQEKARRSYTIFLLQR